MVFWEGETSARPQSDWSPVYWHHQSNAGCVFSRHISLSFIWYAQTCDLNMSWMKIPLMHTLDQSESDRKFLAATSVLLHLLSSTGFMVEAVQLSLRRWNYFKDLDNYFQLALYTLTIIFILGFNNECWCSTHWQWQIGAFAVFFSWINFIFILKYIPYTAVPINIFLSICVKSLELIFLLLVLILAFGVPFYMVFVRTTSSSEVSYCVATDIM